MVSAWAVVQMLPQLASQYNWTAAYLAADLAARGVDSIPGFAYADDVGAIYSALLEYATTTLSLFYGGQGGPAAIANDKQLQAFLQELGPGGSGAINGFPARASVTSVSALAEIAAQVRCRSCTDPVAC
jgi:hypothetical protein